MLHYIQQQVHRSGSQQINQVRRWLALAYTEPTAAAKALAEELMLAYLQGDKANLVRLASLLDALADPLATEEYKPLFVLAEGYASQARGDAQGVAESQAQLPTNQPEQLVAGVLLPSPGSISTGFPPLKTHVFDVATLTVVDASFENPDRLRPFTFATVILNQQGQPHNATREAFYFIEPLPESSQDLEMVAIPGGKFNMGSSDSDTAKYEGEQPVHLVTVPPFFLSKYPITQAQWQAVSALAQINRKLDSAPSRFPGEDRPVEQVNWYDAVEFCDRLSAHTGREYRLPSEAEWEYACRGTTTTPYYFGSDSANLGDYAWYSSNSNGQTHPVGQKKPNVFGLYDMHGNVWEWCLDHWHENYEGAPDDGSAWIDENDNRFRLLRGGSWFYDPRNCRSASRDRINADYRFNDFGFRVVCSAARTL